MPPASLRRHFLPWDAPWLPQAVAWLAADWDRRGPLDLSGVLAIVPTRQSGRRLREALAEHAHRHHTAVFAPRVLTPDTLVAGEPAAGVASRLQALLAWTQVLRGLALPDFRAVLPVDPPARNFPWALRLAQEFARLQATLAEAGLTLGDVAARVGPDFVEADRWSEIGELGRRQQQQLAACALREPQAARIAAAREPLGEPFRRVVLLGVPDPPLLALERLRAIAAHQPIDVVIFAPAAEAGHFDEWGRPAAGHWEQRVIDLADFEAHVHLCADPATQAARLAELAPRYDPGQGTLAFGLADPEVAPLLENELTRMGRAVFNPEGRRLRGEAFYELLASWAALVRDSSFDSVGALARCPDFLGYLQARGGPEFSVARWLAGLDELRARHLPADLAAAIEFAPRLSSCRELAAGLSVMAALRDRLRSREFAHGVIEILRELFAHRQVDLAREADQRWQETVATWTGLMREMAVASAQFGELPPADGWELALRLFGEQRRTGDKPAHALELQGWLELLWEDAPHLAVAGMNDGRVPESVVEDAFLPASLRERLGLQTNAARLARDAYILQALAASRARDGRLDLLLGKTSAAGDPLRPSRLLLRCAEAELPRRVAFLFRAVEPPNAQAPWTRAWQLQPRRGASPERVAVTALRRYLECPFRFYLRTVLRMEPVDPAKSELDAFDFGTLCHATLEQIGRDPLLRDCRDPAVLRTELLHRLERQVHERYGKLLSLPLTIQVESARQRLGRLAELQAAERAAGWEIIAVERPFELEVSGLLIRGKIDRIDRHDESGRVRVLDYKTSDSPVTPAAAHLRRVRPGEAVAAWARVEGVPAQAWVDLQLPLYVRALGAEFPGRLGCGYFNLPKAAGETTLALWDDYSAEWHAAAMRCAEEACAAIRRGEFWPPNGTLRAERDEWAALFHHGVAESIAWAAS